MYFVPYPSIIDSLMYAMVCTRPYITYAMGFIRKYMSKPRKEHRIVINRVFKYLCDTIYYARYFHERIELDRVIDVHGFSNADRARYIDHKRYTSGMFNLF